MITHTAASERTEATTAPRVRINRTTPSAYRRLVRRGVDPIAASFMAGLA